MERACRRIGFHGVGEIDGRRSLGAGGPGLLHGVFERVRTGIVAAHRDQHLAAAPKHMDRYVVALRLAGLHGGLGDGDSGGHRQILVGDELGTGRAGESARERDSGDKGDFLHCESP